MLEHLKHEILLLRKFWCSSVVKQNVWNFAPNNYLSILLMLQCFKLTSSAWHRLEWETKKMCDSLNKILSVHLSGHSQQQMLRCVCWLMWETASRRGKKMLPWGSVWVSSSVPERCVCSGPRGLSLIWGHATSAPLLLFVWAWCTTGKELRSQGVCKLGLIEPNQTALFPLRKT